MIAKTIASHLLESNAVSLSPLDPYTWASGIKSPIYCDNRVTMAYPNIRNDIANAFTTLIRSQFPNVDAIVGTATAGIPQACWVADKLKLPMAYVRPQAKAHGKSKQIEGFISEGSKVVVVEDLISTGGSSIKACEVLRAAGIEVLGVVSVFTYELAKATEMFERANLRLESLSNYSTLIKVAKEKKQITDIELEMLKKWRQNPEKYEEVM